MRQKCLHPFSLSCNAYQVNRVVSFLANEEPSGVVEVLMTELQTIDGAGLMIEPSPMSPYFHIALLSDLADYAVTGGASAVDVDGKDRVRGTNVAETITFSDQRDDEVRVDVA